MMDTTIGGLTVKLKGDSRDLEAAAKRGEKSVDGLNSSVKGVATSLPGVGTAAVAAFAVAGAAAIAATKVFADFTKQGLDLVDSQAKAAREIGSTIKGLRSLSLAAGYAGVNTKDLEASTRKLNESLGRAELQGGRAAAALKNLNLSAKDLIPLDVDARFELIAKRVEDLKLNSSEVASIFKDLGMRSQNLVGFLSDGGKSIQNARMEMEKFNLGVNEAQAARVEQFNDQLTKLRLIADSVKEKVAVQLAPYLSEITKKIEEKIRTDKDFEKSLADSARDIATFVNKFVNSVDKMGEALKMLNDVSKNIADIIPIPRIDKLVTGQMDLNEFHQDLASQGGMGSILATVSGAASSVAGGIYKAAYNTGWGIGNGADYLAEAPSRMANYLSSGPGEVQKDRLWQAMPPFESGVKLQLPRGMASYTPEPYEEGATFKRGEGWKQEGLSGAIEKLVKATENFDARVPKASVYDRFAEKDYEAITSSVLFGEKRKGVDAEAPLVWDDGAKYQTTQFAKDGINLALDSTLTMATANLSAKLWKLGAAFKPSTGLIAQSKGAEAAARDSIAQNQSWIADLKAGLTTHDPGTVGIFAGIAKDDIAKSYAEIAAQQAIRAGVATSSWKAGGQAAVAAMPVAAQHVGRGIDKEPFVEAVEYAVSDPLKTYRKAAGEADERYQAREGVIGEIHKTSLEEMSPDNEAAERQKAEKKRRDELEEKSKRKLQELQDEIDAKALKAQEDFNAKRLSNITDYFLSEEELLLKNAKERADVITELHKEELIGDQEKNELLEKNIQQYNDKINEGALKRLEMLLEGQKTERELAIEHFEAQRDVLEEALERELVTMEEHNRAMEILQEEHSRRIVDIKKREDAEKGVLSAREKMMELRQFSGHLAQMTSVTAGENRKMFELNKVASIANALLDAHEAISGAYKVGSRIGGPMLGAAFGAAAGFAQFARINQIRNTTFGGGQQATAPVAQQIPSDAGGITGERSQGLATINIVGGDSAFFTGAQIRGLIEQINEQVDNGMRIRTA